MARRLRVLVALGQPLDPSELRFPHPKLEFMPWFWGTISAGGTLGYSHSTLGAKGCPLACWPAPRCQALCPVETAAWPLGTKTEASPGPQSEATFSLIKKAMLV